MTQTPATSASRRAMAAAIALLATLMLAAACGSDDTTDGSSGDDAAGADESFPVTIEHQFGTAEIPSEPQRVVSVGFNDQDMILALGVQPVGIRDWYGDQPFATWPWATDALGDAEPEVLSAAEINVEKVASLRPDLIIGIGSGMTEQDYELLSQVAPTVAQSDEFIEYGTPWQDQTLMIGRALGREEQAQELIDDVEGQFADARAEHPEFEGSTAVVAYLNADGGANAYSSGDVRGQLVEAYGMEVPDEINELAGDKFYAEVSAERFDLLDADHLIWATDTPGAREAIEANPIYQQLDVVREGRAIFIEDEVLAGAASFSSPLSLPYVIEHLTPMLAASDAAGTGAD